MSKNFVTVSRTGHVEGSALTLLRWAAKNFGKRAKLACAFNIEDCVLVDLIARHQLSIPIFTLDTGVLFDETKTLWRTIETRYGLTIEPVTPELDLNDQAARYGETLWLKDAELCCKLRKVLPLQTALAPLSAWITGIRREQNQHRAEARDVEWDARFGLLKLNPLVHWTQQDITDYVKAHDVPTNALHQQGYPSIGCQPCTSPVALGEDPRAGRWRGRAKTECGLHPTRQTAPRETEP